MKKGIVPYEDFQKMVRNAPPNSGITAKSIAESLEKKGYDLPPELSKFSAVQPKENMKSKDGFFSTIASQFSLKNAQKNIQEVPSALAHIGKTTLPAVGSIVGGTVGGIMGAPAGPIGIGAGLIAGAATGRAVGQTGVEAIKNLEGREQNLGAEAAAIGGAAKTGAIEGAIDVATLGVGKVGGRLLSPFKSQVDNVAVKLFEKYGVKAPVSAVSKSEAVRQGEAIAAKGVTGASVQNVIQEANTQLSKIGDDLISKMEGSGDMMVAGKEMLEGAKSYETAWRAAKNKLYKEADNQVASRAATLPREYINVDSTKQALDEILSSKSGASELLGEFVDAGKLSTVRKNLDKKLSIKILSDSLDEINKMIPFGSKVDTGDVAALKKVAANLSADLDNHIKVVQPEIFKALSAADEFYGEGIGILNSQVGNTIRRLADSPEKIAGAVIKNNAPSDTRRIVELIGTTEGGPQRLNEVRSAVMKELVDTSKNADGVINGQTFLNRINKMGKTLDELYGPEVSKEVRDLATMASKMDRGQSAAKGSQTAFITKILAFFTALGSGNLPVAGAIAGQDVAFSRLYSTAIGKQFLTTGLQEAIPQGVQQAGRGAMIAIPRIINQENQ
jgi:hypothetical protein